MKSIRISIAIGGALLPYCAHMIGTSGSQRFMLPLSLGGILFFGFFNAICWGSILLATSNYKHPGSAMYPVVIGFAWPALFYLTLDSKSSPLAFVFLPIENLALVLVGWLVGRHVDRDEGDL